MLKLIFLKFHNKKIILYFLKFEKISKPKLAYVKGEFLRRQLDHFCSTNFSKCTLEKSTNLTFAKEPPNTFRSFGEKYPLLLAVYVFIEVTTHLHFSAA